MELSTKATPAKAKLTPPLATIIQTLREVDGKRSLRCYALVDGPEYRCKNSIKPRTPEMELYSSDPPFKSHVAKSLVHLLLCHAHRKKENQLSPLLLALTAVGASSASLTLSGPRRDSCLGRDSLHPDLVRYDDAKTELLESDGQFWCIALDEAGEQCRCAVDQAKLFRYAAWDHEEELDWLLKENLRRTIHCMLCDDHSHWFWLDLYHDLWSSEMDSDDQSDQSTEPDSTMAAEELSDEEESFCSPNGTHTTINIALQQNIQNNYYNISPAQAESSGATCEPAATNSTQTTFFTQLTTLLSPQSVLRLLPRTSEPPSRSTTPTISLSRAPSPSVPTTRPTPSPGHSSSRATTPAHQPSRPATPAVDDDLAAGMQNLDINDSNSPSRGRGRKSTTPQRSARPSASPSGGDGGGPRHTCRSTLRAHEVTAIEHKLATLLRTPISPHDNHQRRHIYVLTTPAYPQLVKIGYTERDMSTRRKEICKDLGLALGDLREHCVVANVPCAERVERLVHGQLAPLKEGVEGRGGRVAHREWFRCDAGFAKELVGAWVKWMIERKPYVHAGLSDKWRGKVTGLERDAEARGEEAFRDMVERHLRWLRQ